MGRADQSRLRLNRSRKVRYRLRKVRLTRPRHRRYRDNAVAEAAEVEGEAVLTNVHRRSKPWVA